MRIVFGIAAMLLLATFAPPSLYTPRPLPAVPILTFQPVPLNSDAPAQRRLGRLLYLRGWSITSNDPRFGGLSALHVEGRRVLALSDAGTAIAFALPGPDGKSSMSDDFLHDGPGPPDERGSRDAEAVAVAGGTVWVAFENRNAIWRYSRESWRAEAGSRPKAMRDWGYNAGSEAMVRLPDGRFLLFAEGGRRADGTTDALLFAGDPAEGEEAAMALRYRAPSGYRITDAALLTDGRLLFLNRRIGWLGRFSAKLTIGRLPPLQAGAMLTGEEAADFSAPIIADNMEALSVAREDGRTIIWIASDDNFSPMQRTLLLKFALAD